MGFRVEGLVFRVQGLGFRVPSPVPHHRQTPSNPVSQCLRPHSQSSFARHDAMSTRALGHHSQGRRKWQHLLSQDCEPIARQDLGVRDSSGVGIAQLMLSGLADKPRHTETSESSGEIMASSWLHRDPISDEHHILPAIPRHPSG